MNHFVCQYASVPNGTTYGDLVAVADQSTNIFNNKYTFPEDRRLTASYMIGNGISAGRVTTPMLRLISYPEIYPLQSAASPGNLPPVNFYGDSGPAILRNDELAAQASNSSGGAVDTYCGMWTTTGRRSPPTGMITAARTTAAITQVVNAWASGPLTFVQQLPSGKYAVVGFGVQSAGALFARLIFPGQMDRPGVIAQQAAGEYDWPIMRNGGMGLLGEFWTYAPPQLEVFATGAGAAQVAVLDLVKVA